MRASAFVLVLSCAVGAAGAAGFDPNPSSATCTTRVASRGRSCNERQEQVVQHEREQPDELSFARSWVSRARGGGSKVPAGAGGGQESGGKDKDRGGGGKAPDEVELALVGNFPNRCA